MRAIWLREFGPPEVLEPGEAADPVPGSDELLIDVAFANITFIETLMRAGRGPYVPELPAIIGNGVGGTVAGSGERVIASLGGSGGYAARAAAGAAGVIAVPDAVALDDAVALVADGRTAVGLIEDAAAAHAAIESRATVGKTLLVV